MQASGQTEGLDESLTLYAVVEDESGNYWPYRTQLADGRWTSQLALGPRAIHRPLPFTVHLATASAAAKEAAEQASADEIYALVGLGNTFPEGFTVLDQAQIVRDS